MMFTHFRTLLAIVCSGLLLHVTAAPRLHTRLEGADTKMGISWPVQEQSAEPVKKFFPKDTQISWWYNWNKNYDTTIFPLDTKKVSITNAYFIPMIFDASFLDNGEKLDTFSASVMGYNEPDMTSAGVSTPVDPVVAADNWKDLVTKLKKDTPKFWSPAVASNKDWLRTFFDSICPDGLKNCDYAPKYLAVHIYTTSVSDFKAQAKSYHDEFGLKIVVTEFACYTFDGTKPAITKKQASQFMNDVTKWLDETDYIHKYAWFGAVRDAQWLYEVPEANRLLTADGYFTDLGKQYLYGGRI